MTGAVTGQSSPAPGPTLTQPGLRPAHAHLRIVREESTPWGVCRPACWPPGCGPHWTEPAIHTAPTVIATPLTRPPTLATKTTECIGNTSSPSNAVLMLDQRRTRRSIDVVLTLIPRQYNVVCDRWLVLETHRVNFCVFLGDYHRACDTTIKSWQYGMGSRYIQVNIHVIMVAFYHNSVHLFIINCTTPCITARQFRNTCFNYGTKTADWK